MACPTNFVRTKLELEEMQGGQTLEIILDGGEPIKNVPRALKEDGHKIVKVEKTGRQWRLLIRKI